MSIRTADKTRRQAMAQMNKNDAFISDHFWLLIFKVLDKMSNRNFRTFMTHQREAHEYCDIIINQVTQDLRTIKNVFHPNQNWPNLRDMSNFN